jgi:hypothetical protein
VTQALPRSTLNLGFKTIIITIFILTLTHVNPTRDPNLNQWPELCLISISGLNFKTIIIIIFIFIFIYLSWTILELRVFYKDILRGKNNKYCIWRHNSSVPLILKVQKFTLESFQKYIYFYIFVYSTKHMFIFIVFIFLSQNINQTLL